MWPALQDITARSIQLGVELAEIIMDRCGTEHAHPLALLLLNLKPLSLYDHTNALHEEYATEYGQQQLLVDDDGTHANDTSDGQRPGIGQGG